MKRNIVKVILSAVLLSVGWLGLSGLPLLVALVPLLMVSDSLDASARGFWKMFGWLCLCWTIWYGLTVWGVWIATPVGPIAALIFGILYTATPVMFYHYVSKRAPRSLSYVLLVAAWITGEYVYNTSQVSFPWLNLGNGFASGFDPVLVQWYSLTGIYGGTLWVLVTNILLFEALRAKRRGAWIAPSLAAVIPVVVSLVMYFTYKMPEQTLAVSVVQPNIDSYTEKFTTSQQQQTQNLVSLMEQSPAQTRLIVMPETALNEGIVEGVPEVTSVSLETLRGVLDDRYPDSKLIVGATTYRMYPFALSQPTRTARNRGNVWYDVYNTALGVDTTSSVELSHKSRLVIGVEMMPDWAILKPISKWIVDLGGTSGGLGTDSVKHLFRAGDVIVGAAICYESIYGDYFADYVRRGARLMTVITNDGWWGNTPIHRQHFSYSRLRAIETRRSIARSANTGISGFINPRGDVVQSLGWDRRGTLSASVPLNDSLTFYTRYGDYLCRIAGFMLALGILYYVVYRVRRKDHLVK